MAEVLTTPALMGACFDEAGISQREDACSIAGFLGDASAIHRLGKNWNAVLGKFGIAYFHSLEFYAPAARLKQSRSNPYRSWSNTKRKDFQRELFRALQSAGVRLRAIGADSVAFHARSDEERRWMTGGVPKPMSSTKWLSHGKPSSVYHLLFRGVVEGCAAMVPKGRKLHIMMSRQDQMRPTAETIYDAMRHAIPECRDCLDNSITFASPLEIPSLQAADLLAFHMRRIASERRTNAAREPEGVFKEILKLATSASDAEFADSDVIDKLCRSLRIRHESNQKLRDEEAKKRRADKEFRRDTAE